MKAVRVSRRDAVGTIVLDRPERFNSLDVETARDLRRAALGMARDREVRAVVLRGRPGVFCSGADLRYIHDGGEPSELDYLTPQAAREPEGHGEVFKEILEYLHCTISEIRRAPKPVLAAVDGIAAAGGLGLAVCCDLVVASERARFEYAYFRTGLCSAESTSFFLPRMLGLRRALDLALLGRCLDAREAQALGLVSAVHPTRFFDEKVDALAARLAAGPTGAYAETKRLMNEAAGVERLDVHLDRELEALTGRADSGDFAEGIEAFFEKRPARFQGV